MTSQKHMVYFMLKRILILCTLFFLAGCTGLGGEPEIIATVPIEPISDTPAIEVVPDAGFPQSPPDLASGAAIFAQHCTACHGANGEGDGELVTSGQVPNPGNFRDPATAREQTPDDWFETITDGNLEKLMPPWKAALTEQQRWDVALYTYTMHYTPEQVELGQILYVDCAECHGEQGRGDGPEAGNVERQVKDLTDQQAMITLSDQNIYHLVFEGQYGVMPSYGNQFNEEELRAVAAYARTLSLTNAGGVIAQTVAQQSTPVILDATALPSGMTPIPTATLDGSGLATALPSSKTVDITGTVSNLTQGGSVPPDLTITLRVFDAANFQPFDELTRETTLAADSTYRFEDVLVENDKLYLTAAEYQGRNFASGVFPGTQTAFDLPITLYELTDDPSVITVNAAVTQLEIGSDTIEATYSVRFVNSSDRLFTSMEAEPDGRYKSVYVTLPPGSLVVGLPDQPRYIIADDQMTLWDTQPMQPGEERFLQVTYLLQYSDGAVIEYPMPFQVDGQVRVLVQPETITLTSEQLPAHGTETLGNEQYQGYGAALTLPPDTLIRYTLNGQADETAVVQPGVVSSDSLPLVVVGVMLAVVILIAVFFALSRRGGKDKQRLIDGLVRQIAELDAQHEAGQINHDLYRNRRETLKARLAELMDQV
jgi:mono/diheme cytochrome c family protein